MELYKKLPGDIRRKICWHFIHPSATLVKLHNSPRGRLMEDIRDYRRSLERLYALPFAKSHNGPWGRPRLLNSLWMEAHLILGDYYLLWKRMFRVNTLKTAEWWIRWRYAANCHKFQINCLWALFTKKERTNYLRRQYKSKNKCDIYQV